jgi:hypothetical protein
MARNHILNTLLYWTIACVACTLLPASEHHGVVKFGGLAVPGATVTATQGDKKLVAITDPRGVYTFADLADGVWNLQVEMLCFATLKNEVAIAPNAPSPEWELKLLPLDEIKAAAPPPAPPTGAPAASTPAATAGTPAAGPTAATPPAKKGSKAAKAAAAEAAEKARPGFQRADLNASNGNGSNGNGSAEPPAGDAASGGIDEATPGASDALLVNGSVSNGVERRAIGNFRKGPGSGYRGDLSTILDNSVLDARSFSITGQDTPRQAYNHLRYGGTFGGPLSIPHLFRTQNGNFFVAYQGVRNRNASTSSSLMPTAAERLGDFSQSLNQFGKPVQLFDPQNNGTPFPGNAIPAAQIATEAAKLLHYYPQPNFNPSARFNYQIPLVGTSGADALQARVNKAINPRNSVNGTFGFQRTGADSPNLFQFVDGNHTQGMRLDLSWRHTFNKTFYGTLGAQYSRYSARNTPYWAFRSNVSDQAGIGGNNQDPQNWGPPNLSFNSGYAGLSDGQESFLRNQTSAVSYSVMWLKRPHNITMGGDFRRIQLNFLGQQDARGSFGFTGAATQAKTADGLGVAGTGNDFADFLLGTPDTVSIAYGNADKYFRSSSYDAYFTDDWRVSAGFTLNAGARWEYASPIVEKYGRLVNLDITPGFAAEAPVAGLSPNGPLTGRQYPDSLVRPDKHGIQPRVGLSWRPIFGSSLLIRAGYGVTYNTSVYNTIAFQMAQQSPPPGLAYSNAPSKSLSVPNGPPYRLTLANAFNTPGATNTFAIDPDFRIGYAQNWQASAQVDLPAAMVMTATYIGIKGTRAVQVFLPNTYPAGAVNPCPSCLPGYAYMTSNGNSTREAGQMQLRRRLHNGLTATAQYTYSRSFDNAALGGRGQGSSVIAQNWLDLSAERGPSNFDQKHLLTLQTQYSSGVGVHGGALLHGWKGAAFKGWTLTNQITAGSGLPTSPIYSEATVGTGVTGSIRPDATGVSVQAAPPGRHLNPAAYAAPQPGQWGTAGRNSIVGPSQFSLNASLGRTFAENLDLRFDSTNTLNHVTYPSWNTAVLSSQFGLPSTANAMRSLQATLRWRF